MTLLDVENLSVKYESFTALKDVNFSIQKNEFMAVLGENGSGKTTLIKAILGLKEPHTGLITWDKAIRLGYLPQHLNVQDRSFPATVKEVILTGALAHQKGFKHPTKAMHEKMQAILKDLSIAHLLDQRIGTLSGGQQQRVLLARTLMGDPDILIMDEPTSALDPSMRSTFYDILKSLNEKGMTIMIITHDVGSASDVLKRVVYLDQTIIFDGTFDEYCENEAISPYIHTHRSHHHGDHS